MSSNLDRFKKDLSRLVQEGSRLDFAMRPKPAARFHGFAGVMMMLPSVRPTSLPRQYPRPIPASKPTSR